MMFFLLLVSSVSVYAVDTKFMGGKYRWYGNKEDNYLYKSVSSSPTAYPEAFPFGTVYKDSLIEVIAVINTCTNITSTHTPSWVNVIKTDRFIPLWDPSLEACEIYFSIDTSRIGTFSTDFNISTDKGEVAIPLSITVRDSPPPRQNLFVVSNPFAYGLEADNWILFNSFFEPNNIKISHSFELPENINSYDALVLGDEFLYELINNAAGNISRLKDFIRSGKRTIIIADMYYEDGEDTGDAANLLIDDFGLKMNINSYDITSIDRSSIIDHDITKGVNNLEFYSGIYYPIVNTSSQGRILIRNPSNETEGFLAVSNISGEESLIVLGIDSFLWFYEIGFYDDPPLYNNILLFTNMLGVGNCSDSVQNGNEKGVDCGAVCSNKCGLPDISISSKNITFSKVGSKINVTALFYRDGVIDPLKVIFIQVYNDEKVDSQTITTDGDIASVLLDLERDHKVIILVDPTNEIDESCKSNNRAEKEYDALPNIYIDIATIEKIKPEIMDYIKNNVKYSYVTEDKSAADIFVHVGRFNSKVVTENQYTLDNLGWGWKGGIVTRLMEKEGKPYGGLVGSFTKNGKKYIFIYGNSIDGEIAAVKEFILYESKFVNVKYSYLINKYNVNALAVYDYLHTSENKEYYNENSDEFASVVHKALNGMYTMQDFTITANVAGENVDLRLRHIEPDNSELFLSYKDPSGLPVVMAGGLWSDITAWDELGRELAIEGRDVWLIELTGGAGMDCDSCPNYLYSDLTDSVLPAYIDYIKDYTGKSKVQYVGHSNGARVALDALTEGEVNPDDVDTLVLVGVPVTLNNYSFTASMIRELDGGGYRGDLAIDKLQSNKKYHVKTQDYAKFVDPLLYYTMGWIFLKSKYEISLNLMDYYNDLYISTSTPVLGVGLSLNKVRILIGNKEGIPWSNHEDNDGAVNIIDGYLINSTISANDKKLIIYRLRHGDLTSHNEPLKDIKEVLG